MAVYDITHFRESGDPDDSAATRRAFAAARAGDAVKFPPGRYRVSETTDVPTDVDITTGTEDTE